MSTPKQIHKVLQELHEQSGDNTSGSQESGGNSPQSSGSPSGVEEVLETLGGN